AFAADTVNLTRFSKTVSGIAPTGATSVTVDLLRNTHDVNNAPVRQQVDTFTATPDATTHIWSGSFTTHAFSTTSDQVEVNYTGVPTETQVTIGGGRFLTTANTPPANEVNLSADAMDGCFGIASDGSDLEDQCTSKPFNVTINGTAVPGGPFTGTLPLATHVSNTDAVVITQATTSGPTTVNLTDSAPLLTPLPVGATVTPQTNSMPEASCAAFLVTNEVVCQNLDPGSYTLSQVRGGTTIATTTLTVPGAPAGTPTGNNPPSEGAAALAGIQGG